jgi:hypothetical protein
MCMKAGSSRDNTPFECLVVYTLILRAAQGRADGTHTFIYRRPQSCTDSVVSFAHRLVPEGTLYLSTSRTKHLLDTSVDE